MSLTTPEKVRKLQRAFYAKAKEQPSYRFHQLYDKIYREDILGFAYQRCKANAGAAGVDGQSFEMVEQYGRDRWLGERRSATTGHCNHPRPSGPDGHRAGDRTDL